MTGDLRRVWIDDLIVNGSVDDVVAVILLLCLDSLLELWRFGGTAVDVLWIDWAPWLVALPTIVVILSTLTFIINWVDMMIWHIHQAISTFVHRTIFLGLTWSFTTWGLLAPFSLFTLGHHGLRFCKWIGLCAQVRFFFFFMNVIFIHLVDIYMWYWLHVWFLQPVGMWLIWFLFYNRWISIR